MSGSKHLPHRLTLTGRAPLLLACVLALAPLAGCVSNSYLSVRRVPRNPLAVPLHLLSIGGPKPTQRTEQLLREYGIAKAYKKHPDQALASLQAEIDEHPNSRNVYAFAELAYIQADSAKNHGHDQAALDLYSAAVAHAYLYLFAPHLERERNHYDPQFRQACDIYNAALEQLLRIINKQGRLRPGERYTIRSGQHQLDVQINMKGRWRPEDFERFEFVSDFEVRGLVNHHVTYGLGVPLIAVRSKNESLDPAAKFYAKGMSFPVTAVLHAAQRPCKQSDDVRLVACALDLYDPFASDRVEVAGYEVPLESDLSTPLGYFLDSPEFNISQIATWGLLNPASASEVSGIYMLEAYDPNKIPVLMVHGLWSSPETWTEMFNDLKSMPEIRHRYQFWTYLYPTGQPFWISAAKLRRDLRDVRQTVDPNHRSIALDQIVLIGHSMGGLVSRLQTLESGKDFWHIVSDKPFEELNADEATRRQLAEIMFFQPSRSIRCVITIATPYRGSEFANDYTRWLGRKLIKLPSMLIQTKARVVRDNPDFFKDSSLLDITTSIDSLAPDSPMLPVMQRARMAPWIKYHNIVGVIPKRNWLGRISRRGDGVVDFESAHLEDAISELVVESDHVHVHQEPRSIMEVRRILLKHSAEMYAETARASSVPVGFSKRVAPDTAPTRGEPSLEAANDQGIPDVGLLGVEEFLSESAAPQEIELPSTTLSIGDLEPEPAREAFNVEGAVKRSLSDLPHGPHEPNRPFAPASPRSDENRSGAESLAP